MKTTNAEKLIFLLLIVQAFLVVFYGRYENSYPRIYEDILGMVSLFLLIIMDFIRKVVSYFKMDNKVKSLAHDSLEPLLERIREARDNKEETLTLCVSDLALLQDHLEDLERCYD